MRKFTYLIAVLILIILVSGCQIERNPDDPDIDNSDYTIKYYTRMLVDKLNFFSFSEKYLVPDFDTASKEIRFYEVFYFANSDKIYKIKLFFEKVAGIDPRLYSWFTPDYDEQGRIIKIDTYRRYGSDDLLFILAYSVTNEYDDKGQLIKRLYYDHFPLLTDELADSLVDASQGITLETNQRSQAMEIFYDKGLETKRVYYFADDTKRTIYYSYDGSGNVTKISHFNNEDQLEYSWDYDDEGFGTELTDYTNTVQWQVIPDSAPQ